MTSTRFPGSAPASLNVPRPGRGIGPVLTDGPDWINPVGTFGSEQASGGRRALEWAVGEADARGSAVQAVTAWSWDGLDYAPVTATNAAEARERATRLLDDEIRALVARHGSHLPVAAEVVEGSPAEVLAAAGRAADLLVLGSHGHSRVRRTVLGSVSEACIRQARCANRSGLAKSTAYRWGCTGPPW